MARLEKKKKHEIPILLDVGLIVQSSNGTPGVELRRRVYDKKLVRVLVESAIAGRPVIVLPIFQNRLKSMSSLIDSGIMYYEPEDGAYYFTL